MAASTNIYGDAVLAASIGIKGDIIYPAPTAVYVDAIL